MGESVSKRAGPTLIPSAGDTPAQVRRVIEGTRDVGALRRIARYAAAWSAADAPDRQLFLSFSAMALFKAGDATAALQLADQTMREGRAFAPSRPADVQESEAVLWHVWTHAAVARRENQRVVERLDELRARVEGGRGVHGLALARTWVDAIELVEATESLEDALRVLADRAQTSGDLDQLGFALRRLVALARRRGDWQSAFQHQVRLTQHLERELARDKPLPHRAEAEESESVRALMYQLTQQQEELAAREAEATRRRLATAREFARMSHEIRTPLHGVVGSGDLLLRTGLTHDQQNLAEAMRASSEIALGVINSILDLSSLEAGAVTLDLERCLLSELARDALLVVRDRAASEGLRLQGVIEKGVAEYLRTDSLRLRQVLTNLLGNAVKFTDSGTVGLTVSAADDIVCFDVWDTGRGIPQSELPRLFERYYRGATGEGVSGTGLGLAITQELVRRLGGALTVTSVVGQGSHFRVRLPIDAKAEGRAESLDLMTLPNHRDPVVERPQTRAGRVLVAEDNTINARVVARMLEMLGWEATVVGDGHEALETAMVGNFELVLMDCNMPHMDGWEAARLLRRRGYAGRIVAFTADAMGDVRQRCMEAGMDSVLTKPARLTDLQTVLSGRP